MGKKRRENIDRSESRWVSPREKVKRWKAAFGDWSDDQHEKMVMQASRQKRTKSPLIQRFITDLRGRMFCFIIAHGRSVDQMISKLWAFTCEMEEN